MKKRGMNVYRRKDGRYEGRFKNGTKANGKPKYRSVYGHSVEEVREKMEELCADKHTCSTELTVRSLFSEWIQAVAARVKESTISNYCMKAEIHILPVFGDLDYNAVSAAKVHDFIHTKLKNGLSSRYVSDIVVLLKAIFKYASHTYQLHNPIANVMLPKKKKPEIKLLNDSEQKVLQAHLLKNQNRTSLGIALSLYTGLRIGELCALKWKDIDFEKRTLIVRHTVQRISKNHGTAKTQLIITEPKSSTSLRTIPIPECLIKMLKVFQYQPSAYVLSDTDRPVEPRTMQYRFASVLKNENLPSIHFHALRHMFATKCIALGFDVKTLSEILGHSSVEITLNRYVHSSLEQKQKYMERLTFTA